MKNSIQRAVLPALLVLPAAPTSCESAPGTSREQGAAVGGVTGAIIGHKVGDGVLGALIGGVLGAGGGWIAGGEIDRIKGKRTDDARGAIDRAQSDPANVEDVRNASTADLNDDGFVTLDEIIALANAGLNSDEILNRLERTGQVFELTDDQKDYLVDNGVPREVTRQVSNLNVEGRENVGLAGGDDVIGRPR